MSSFMLPTEKESDNIFLKLDVHFTPGCGLKSYDSRVPGSFVILDVCLGVGGGAGGGDVIRRADLNLFLSCRMGD